MSAEHLCKSRLFFISFLVSISLFFLISCSVPKNGNSKNGGTAFSPILVNRYFAEINLGKEQISNNPQLAIEYFNSAIEKNFNRPEAFFGRGAAQLVLEKYTLAIKDFDLALEADWPVQDSDVGKSNVYLYRAIAGIGLLETIDAKKETDTYILTVARIHGDLNIAEFYAGISEDHELIKQITQTRHLFDKLSTPKKP